METQPLQFWEMLSLILSLLCASHQDISFCIYIELFPTRSRGNVMATLSGHTPRGQGDPPPSCWRL